MKQKIEYIAALLLACMLTEFALFSIWAWNWSGFEWSPFGYENSGLEGLVFFFFIWPGLLFSQLIRLGLMARWRFPVYVWLLHPVTALAAFPSEKGFAGGIIAALLMLLVFIGDAFSIRKARSRFPVASS